VPSQTLTSNVIPAGRTAIYVSIGGSDGGDGSAARPFATLQRAVNASNGNSTISVSSGSYATSGVYLGGGNSGLVIQGTGNVVLDAHGQQTVLDIRGGSNISLSGLTFADAAGPALVLDGATGVSVTGDSFINNSGAVLLENNGSRNTLSRNTITNTSGSAIEVKDGSNANTFDSNTITGVGAPETYGGAFFLHGANGNQITHNVITNTQGAAIDLADFYSTSPGTQNLNNMIAYNAIYDADLSSTDSGAIYILGRSNANTLNTVTMNFVSGTGRAGQHSVGIYLDDGASGVTVTGNIVTGIGSDGFQIHGGSNNAFSGNVFNVGSSNATAGLFQAGPSDQYSPNPLQNNSVTGNIVVSENPGARRSLFESLNGGSPNVSGNDYWSNTGASLNAFPDTNPSYVNPGVTGGNYVTSGDGIGFAQINQTLIGLRPA